jgi:hypothetical protein
MMSGADVSRILHFQPHPKFNFQNFTVSDLQAMFPNNIPQKTTNHPAIQPN